MDPELPNNPSLYDRIVIYYIRASRGDLIRCFGKHGDDKASIWSIVQPLLSWGVSEPYWRLPAVVINGEKPVDIHEWHLRGQSIVIGLILQPATIESLQDSDSSFAHHLLTHIGNQSDIWGTFPAAEHKHGSPIATANTLVELCNAQLLFHPSNSQWDNGGRDYLLHQISFFTSHGLPIQMVLPAFPCKSSNGQKIAGQRPDRGEELALRRLHQVLGQIEAIYSPGASLYIVSDGHVFSDCSKSNSALFFGHLSGDILLIFKEVGVDDNMVDLYNADLQKMNHSIWRETKHRSRVVFQSLADLLTFNEQQLSQHSMPRLNHYLPTTISSDAEACRQMMMLVCQPSRATLKKQIRMGDPALLALYRGFSRFMLEDLALLPYSQSLSRTQRKKTAEKVAFEMILRNQAYSNLVELFFPDHIRLSIHAHPNSSPKFGITLFDPTTTKVVSSLNDLSNIVNAAPSIDLLHIPTPWHNCVIKVAGIAIDLVAKSHLAQEALRLGQVQGHWVEGDMDAGCGGYFELNVLPSEKKSRLAITETVISSPTLLQSSPGIPDAIQQPLAETPAEKPRKVFSALLKMQRLIGWIKFQTTGSIH